MKQVCFKNANSVDVLEGRCFDGDVLVEDGRIAADGTPKEVFSQVELLHDMGLAAPETTELCWRLNQRGFRLPLDALGTEECAQALFESLKA